jgi:hypothetical protein
VKMVESRAGLTKPLAREFAFTSIEEIGIYSMTTTLTEVWPVVAHFAGLCEVHRLDLDSLISSLDAQ